MRFRRGWWIIPGVLLVLLSQQPAQARTQRDCTVCPALVQLEAGSFEVGSDPGAVQRPFLPADRVEVEQPKQRVNLHRPFVMGKTEVTVAEYRAFILASQRPASTCLSFDFADGKWKNEGATWFAPGFEQGDDHPVTCVSWEDAIAYTQWLSEEFGRGYRLPSETEWEYAARAGTQTLWTWGEDKDLACEFANVADDSGRTAGVASSLAGVFDCNDGHPFTAPADFGRPNPWGLHGTIGNVGEWTADCLVRSLRGIPLDGSPRHEPDCSDRTIRGGAWFNPPLYNRPAFRYGTGQDEAYNLVGFRIAGESEPPPGQAVAATQTRGLGLPRDAEILLFADDEYPDWPQVGEPEQFAAVDGMRMKSWVERLAGIARESRDSGQAYWGRLPGTEADQKTRRLVADELSGMGFEIEEQAFVLPEDWTPRGWRMSYVTGESRRDFKSAYPVGETAATPAEGLRAPAIWVGLGAAPDFLDRDVAGKAVVIYSQFVPGGRSHSASRRARLFDANERATALGAALIINVMGVPGDAQFNPLGAPDARHGVPLMTISQDEGFELRDRLGAGETVFIELSLDVELRRDVPTANVIARLPGASQEEIVLAAHGDGFFEGAMDNASGIASGLEIARYHAAIPRSDRPRSLVFFLFPDHHHGEVGLKLWESSHDWSRVALVLTLEHPSQTQLYWYNDDLMTSNAIGAFRWHVTGSPMLRELVLTSLRRHGVSTYRVMNAKPKLTRRAPGFHIIDHVIYHTTLDVPGLVPAEGLERSTRAFLEIIDRVNRMPLGALRAEN